MAYNPSVITPKVGDTVYYRAHNAAVYRGTVYQVEGGKDGDLTEVFWGHLGQAGWMKTSHLWAKEPSWDLDQACLCGCRFGAHSESGCISHQIHTFQPVALP